MSKGPEETMKATTDLVNRHDLAAPDSDYQDTIRVPNHEYLKLGSWVWVKEDKEEDDTGEEDKGWFACIVHIGSNHIKVEGPSRTYSSNSNQRIHFNEIDKCITIEKDPDSVIKEHVDDAKYKVRTLLGTARKLLADLGIKDKLLEQAPENSTALAVASSTTDINEHKTALIKAEKETLPEIFEKVKSANKTLAHWSGIKILEMEAVVGAVEGKVSEIKGRIRTVQLYAGLTEDVKLVRKGEPAGTIEKLRIMQRRCYMDEESLLDYKLGGMEFKNIGGFDKWLSKKKNFNRIFPFQKCMVAFRVRRHIKEREWDGTFAGVFWIMDEEEADKYTYLYVRNGDRLYRLVTDLEFGPKLFPGKTEFVLGQKMWGKKFSGITELITDGEFQELVNYRKEERKKKKAWDKAHPKKEHWHNPHECHSRDLSDEYESYDPGSVYFDDMDKIMKDQIEDYNLISYIVQGLFDRSEVLHPHPPAQLWSPVGFEERIELIYDVDNALNPSDAPPSWEDYRAACNESLGIGSVTIGQELVWEKREARRENARNNRNWRNTRESTLKTYSPYGNPGPGRISAVDHWMPRVKKAVYRWQRERSWSSKENIERYSCRKASEYIDDKIKVVPGDLFNISAYKPGDYLQFFKDPRTRAGYLKWANYLLSAEEYHAGNKEFQPGATEE